MHIGLNAHLLAGHAGYRSAGIHGYMYNTLAHLRQVAPPDWSLTVLVGADNPAQFDGMAVRRSRMATASPLRRIIWEQFAQPWQLAPFDLYHALAFVAPLVLTVPAVVTVYDLSFVHYPQVLTTARRLYLRLLTGLSCRRARRVIAISHSTARDVTTTLGIPAARVDVAAPGYDPRLYYPRPPEEIAAFRQRHGLPERFWLFLGTLEPRKNLPVLLRAYASLPAGERLPLLLGGGKGWLYDEIFATIHAHNLESDVRWLGYLPAEDLPLWYNSAEVFVYPSVFEGFGLPVLEAMACGTPVIVSDASSLPEVAGQAGRLVPPGDIAAWTEALYTASIDAGWRDQARTLGLEEVKRYAWEKTALAIVRSYECALKMP